MDPDLLIKGEIKEEIQEDESMVVDEVAAASTAAYGSQQPSSSSQRSSQNGVAAARSRDSRGDEPMEATAPLEEERIRPMTPPLRERTRSRTRSRSREHSRERSRSRERSAQFLRSEEEASAQIHLTDKTKAGVYDYQHIVYHSGVLVYSDINKSVNARLKKIFGYVRYALEAFESRHHVFYSSDDMDERKTISDYARRKTLADYKSGSRVFIVTRNEYIANERLSDLGMLVTGACEVLIDSTPEKLGSSRCLISTIKAFQNFYLQFPGFFAPHDVIIFEDFQYFGDSQVGHFYEEALLAPPVTSQCVFLSSRIANADELSKWIFKCEANMIERSETIKAIDCITVLKRNFTFNHFITRQYEGTLGHVVNKDGVFDEGKFIKATKIADKKLKTDDKKPGMTPQAQVAKLVRTLLFRVVEYPILVYSFDTDEIDNTVNLLNQISLHSERDQMVIEKIYSSELQRLSKDDSEMREVKNLLPFLQRGIAPYHYGMFPFLRKLIKMFFVKGYIKILVADNSIIKETNFQFRGAIILHDRYRIELGYYRWMKPGEYKEICERIYGKTVTEHQTPTIILVNGDEDMPLDIANDIFTNNIPTIESQIKITPTLLLSIIRSPILHEGDAITKSFERYKRIEHAKKIESELREKDRELQNFAVEEEEYLQRYQEQLDYLTAIKNELRTHKFTPFRIEKFMNIGRVVKIRMNNRDFGYCVIVYRKKDIIDVILNVTKESYEAEDDRYLRPAEKGLKNKIVVYRGRLTDVYVVTQERLSIPQNLYGEAECNVVLKHLNKMVENFLGEVPELEIGHLKIEDPDLRKKHADIVLKEKELKELKDRITDFQTNYQQYQEKMKFEEVVNALDAAYDLAKCEDSDELQRNLFSMLAPFDYYNAERTELIVKGKFAIDLPVKENIMLTELFFNPYFHYKSMNDILLILSTFIDMEVIAEDLKLNQFQELFDDFTDNQVQRFGQHLRKSKVILHALTYIKSFNPTLFHFLDLWCKKYSFKAAATRTEDEIRSGFIAVYVERLHELLVRIIANSHLIPRNPNTPDTTWTERLKELDLLITRDIPFTSV